MKFTQRPEEIKQETAGSLLRLAGLLTLGIALFLGTLFLIVISSCPVNLFDRTLQKYPDVTGSIFFRQLRYYSPSLGCTGLHEFPFPNQQPRVLCEMEGDTVVLWSDTPLDNGLSRDQVNEMSNFESSYFYKHKLFTNSFVRISKLSGKFFGNSFLDYDIFSKRFLKWDPREDVLLLLNREFEVKSELTPFLRGEEVVSGVRGVEFIRGGIAVQFSDTLRLYHLGGDSLTFSGRKYQSSYLEAVSHSGETAIFGRQGEDETIPFLLNITTGVAKRLHFKQEFGGACFSPNDSLIAYSRVTNNLTDEVTLFIYDLHSGRLRKTGVQNASRIDAWIRSEPPVADSLVQSD